MLETLLPISSPCVSAISKEMPGNCRSSSGSLAVTALIVGSAKPESARWIETPIAGLPLPWYADIRSWTPRRTVATSRR